MKKEKIHLIGIGGISMSGIAEVLLHKGYQVSGSDLKDNHLLKRLRGKGAKIYIGHSAEQVKDADLVVVSNAIPEKNSELSYARKQGIPVLKRAEMIAEFMKDKTGIAISGTHGKTTTTSMLYSILERAGIDPTVMVGGELENIGGNVRIGDGDYFITEADESDGSFLFFDPRVVIVTNMELDHIDYYDSREKLITTFKKFIDKIPPEGQAILWAEDEEIMNLVDRGRPNILTYGFNKGDIQVRDIKLLPFGSYYTVDYRGNELGTINLQIPGKHNILNSMATIGAAMFLGLSFTDIRQALEEFSGVKRRFDKKGLIGDILVVDDYAHHPTEIKATIKAARNTGYERVIAVFQPHRYSRTKHLMQDFSQSFNEVDHLIITDIYGAGEKPLPGVKAQDLVDMIARNTDITVDYIQDINDAAGYLQEIIRPRDIILTIGAGDVYKVGEILLKRMKKLREMA